MAHLATNPNFGYSVDWNRHGQLEYTYWCPLDKICSPSNSNSQDTDAAADEKVINCVKPDKTDDIDDDDEGKSADAMRSDGSWKSYTNPASAAASRLTNVGNGGALEAGGGGRAAGLNDIDSPERDAPLMSGFGASSSSSYGQP